METIEKPQELASTEATGIKTEIYAFNSIKDTSLYSNKTTMSGLTIETDPENKISSYLRYSTEEGYVVLKSGWYYITLESVVQSSGTSDVWLEFYVNEKIMGKCTSWTNKEAIERNDNCFSMYLKENDKIYFSSYSNGSVASLRDVAAHIYPMF